MNLSSRVLVGSVIFSIALVSAAFVWSQPPKSTDQLRADSIKLQKDGNFKEAFDGFRQLILEERHRSKPDHLDVRNAIISLQRLNRWAEADKLLDSATVIHDGDWRILQEVADQIARIPKQGKIIAGEFERSAFGRRQGRVVNSMDRDRVRALQLMRQAAVLAEKKATANESAALHMNLARHLLTGRNAQQSWRLQHLTDLDSLPEYEDGYGYRSGSAAPVDLDGNAVFHQPSKTWARATNDGERWRWAMQQAVELVPERQDEVTWRRAEFLAAQFSVVSLQQMGWFGRLQSEDGERSKGILSLQTLTDNETVCRLATGIKRFNLPESHNHVALFKQLSEDSKGYGAIALGRLARIYENRMQFPKAAERWRESIGRFGDRNNTKGNSLKQIVGNWGQFDPVMTQPSGKGAQLQYRFRNGQSVSFTAHRIEIQKLLADVKKYLRSNPPQVKWDEYQIGNLGHRIASRNQKKYLGEQVATWTLKLKPRPNHFDKRVDVASPLQKGGAYWVQAKMQDGNSSSMVVWVADTAIIRKRMEGHSLYLIADAESGSPVANAKLEFFGFRTEAKRVGRKTTYKTTTKEFSAKADKLGQVQPDAAQHLDSFQWFTTATTDDGRFAHLGFHGAWTGRRYDPTYDQKKVFVVTDRPVYRPRHKVQFKCWVKHPRYDAPENRSEFANRQFTIDIHDPKGNRILTKSYRSDRYGGLAGEYELPKDAALGVYRLSVRALGGGSGSFRVEEYKKPEFEVSIEAPKKPILLGEKFKAKVLAKYYFGAPVQEATVKIKVTRSDHTSHWFPYTPWDWFYGPGFWWYAGDYSWYQGSRGWLGCIAPPFWPGFFGHQPPELVLELEREIGPNGEVEVEIDSAIAKAIHGDSDHKYSITAEVRDASRRTIVGAGNVIAARKPFKVYAWVDRGFYQVGDPIHASFMARTLDQRAIQGDAHLKLLRVTFDEEGTPVEEEIRTWESKTDEDGKGKQSLQAANAGQYRLAISVTDKDGNKIDGGYVFTVRGQDDDGSEYRFDTLELIAEKQTYKVGEKVKLQINTDRADSTVYLFARAVNGTYLPPKILKLKGKSTEETLTIAKADMPNIYVEVMTVADGKVHTAVRQIAIPPEKRILNVEVVSDKGEYRPREEATIKVRVTDHVGENYVGSAAVAVYDKALEYISGGANFGDIREYFWKWKRQHRPEQFTNLGGYSSPTYQANSMRPLGAFGNMVADTGRLQSAMKSARSAPMAPASFGGIGGGGPGGRARGSMAMAMSSELSEMDGALGGPGQPALVEPTVRSEFADTALWVAAIETDENGIAEVSLNMPDNLTTWKVQAWGVGHGARVGAGSAEVITSKNVIVRLQAPRFFTERDEAVLSAVVHNYLDAAKSAQVSIDVDGPVELLDDVKRTVRINAEGEVRVDWRVRITGEGNAVIRMTAKTDVESDSMEMSFPCQVFGAERVESWVGSIRGNESNDKLMFNVPLERRVDQTRLEIRYSPSLAGAMISALPYLAEYPYGCTEQTLNRFIPAAITQRTRQRMNIDLKDIKKIRSNLNAQEIGNDRERAKQWKRFDDNPVFDVELLDDMVKTGVKRLGEMQNRDGGWGWFSGSGERSWPHTTAVVVRGLSIAQQNDVDVDADSLKRGLDWLARYQAEQVTKLKNQALERKPMKSKAGNLDALVYHVLVDAKRGNEEMREFLYRDRNSLTVYAKCAFGLALHRVDDQPKLTMILRNIRQFLVEDDENETALLNVGRASWWSWHGDEIEANAFYLKLLTKVDPKSEIAPRIVKYLLNNRKHATYWKSTRDTAICVEAFADYLKATEELEPNMTVEVWFDGEKKKEVRINQKNLFTFDNRFVLEGEAVEGGEHRLEIRRKGSGPLYYNVYLTNFTLEDEIEAAGLEVKVERQFYKLVKRDKKERVVGSRGQSVEQAAEAYDRVPLKDLRSLTSGDLVEVELKMTSKNDYEYILFEDMKAAGLEPVDVRSGYVHGSSLAIYREMRDNRVGFFMRSLPRGVHSMSYRLRAETPGSFGALPAQAYGMYAPELRGNSRNERLQIVD